MLTEGVAEAEFTVHRPSRNALHDRAVHSFCILCGDRYKKADQHMMFASLPHRCDPASQRLLIHCKEAAPLSPWMTTKACFDQFISLEECI
jgi:hypothetical protein